MGICNISEVAYAKSADNAELFQDCKGCCQGGDIKDASAGFEKAILEVCKHRLRQVKYWFKLVSFICLVSLNMLSPKASLLLCSFASC